MKDINDIKSPIELVYNYLPFILTSIALLTLVVVFIYLSLRKKTEEPVIQKSENLSKKLSAKELALLELEKIKKEKLIELNRYQVLYNRLTDIVKNYLTSEYKLDIETKTTKEIIKDINNLELNNQLKKHFEQSLKNYDYAKYSGYKVDDRDMNESLDLTTILFKTI